MNTDITLPCGSGYVNVRVGAIIMNNGKVLMAGNERCSYLYSVGGRVQFGETAEEAVVREVYEETGVRLEVDRLGFVHENFFRSDAPDKDGQLMYEISFFFYMKTLENFSPVCNSFTENNDREYLAWVAPDDSRRFYPEFFRTELIAPVEHVKHFVTDGR